MMNKRNLRTFTKGRSKIRLVIPQRGPKGRQAWGRRTLTQMRGQAQAARTARAEKLNVSEGDDDRYRTPYARDRWTIRVMLAFSRLRPYRYRPLTYRQAANALKKITFLEHRLGWMGLHDVIIYHYTSGNHKPLHPIHIDDLLVPHQPHPSRAMNGSTRRGRR